jgi:dihydrofolate reductase
VTDDADGTVVLYVATSLDGYLADEDGGVDFLDPFDEEDAPDGYEAFLAGVNCLLMGSHTYEQVLGFGDWPYGDRPTYVLTTRDLPRAGESVELVAGDAAALARRLRREYGTVWLVGGAELAGSLLRAGAVDEVRLTVVPVVLGGGIRLFAGATGRHGLALRDHVARGAGVVELRYAVAN